MMTGFSAYHSDAEGRPGVVDYFFSPHPGRGAGAKRRLKRSPPPERLVGDPNLFSLTVRALTHTNLYRFGVLSFDAGDIDPAAFNDGDPKLRLIVAEIIDLLKETLFPGVPIAARPHLIIGTHTHAGRLEVNFAVPQMVIRPDGTQRAYNPEPPTEGARALWVAQRDLINLRFGFADPDDPARQQLFSGPSWRRKRAAAAVRDGSVDIDLIDALINGLAVLAKTLMPQDRNAFVEIVNDHFAPVGMQVTTVSHNSLTVGPSPGTSKPPAPPFRLKGILCQAAFSPDRLILNDPEASAERQKILQTAPQRYATAWTKMADYNRMRFGQGAWPEMSFDPEAWRNGTKPPETCLPLRNHLLPITPFPEDKHDHENPDADGNEFAGHRQPDAIRPPERAVAPDPADRRPAQGGERSAFDDRAFSWPAALAQRTS